MERKSWYTVCWISSPRFLVFNGLGRTSLIACFCPLNLSYLRKLRASNGSLAVGRKRWPRIEFSCLEVVIKFHLSFEIRNFERSLQLINKLTSCDVRFYQVFILWNEKEDNYFEGREKDLYRIRFHSSLVTSNGTLGGSTHRRGMGPPLPAFSRRNWSVVKQGIIAVT